MVTVICYREAMRESEWHCRLCKKDVYKEDSDLYIKTFTTEEKASEQIADWVFAYPFVSWHIFVESSNPLLHWDKVLVNGTDGFIPDCHTIQECLDHIVGCCIETPQFHEDLGKEYLYSEEMIETLNAEAIALESRIKGLTMQKVKKLLGDHEERVRLEEERKARQAQEVLYQQQQETEIKERELLKTLKEKYENT